MEELEIDMIENKISKLLGDWNMENEFKIDKENRKKTRETKNTKNNSWCNYTISYFKKIFISHF